MKRLLNAFHGWCMAAADSVPGVSGGTIAFILGFYETFIYALASLFGSDSGARKKAFVYLCQWGVGWLVGIVLFMLLLAQLFEQNIYFLSSLFLGLTVISIPFIIKAEWAAIRGKYRYLPFLLLGGGLVCTLSFTRGTASFMNIANFTALDVGPYVYLFLAGALAIMAMVLPGISGSTLLLILGVYLPIINAVRELVHGNLGVFPGLFAFGLGIFLSAVTFLRLIRNALRKYRGPMLYFILGLMVGSLFAIVMGPTTLSVPHPPLHWTTFHPEAFLLGGAILLGLEQIKRLTERKHSQNCQILATQSSTASYEE